MHQASDWYQELIALKMAPVNESEFKLCTVEQMWMVGVHLQSAAGGQRLSD